MSLTSCISQPTDTIAIDVLLTLPEDIKLQALEMNEAILSEHPDNFRLDEDHIPHITLLQCYISQSDLPQVTTAIRHLDLALGNDTLSIENLQYKTDQKESFASLGVKKSQALLRLHKAVIETVKPFIVNYGDQNAYIQNRDASPIDQFTIDYVPKFISDHSFENYNPHISLGVANTQLLDSLEAHHLKQIRFISPSIGIYQLGGFGTARKLLWESE